MVTEGGGAAGSPGRTSAACGRTLSGRCLIERNGATLTRGKDVGSGNRLGTARESRRRTGWTMSEQNAMVVRQMIDRVLNGRDLTALDQFVAEDFVELDPFPGQGPGREGLREVMAG